MSFKDIISSGKQYLFASITLLGFLFVLLGIGRDSEQNPTGRPNLYFVAIGLVLILPFAIYWIRTNVELKKRRIKELNRTKNLKENGIAVLVNLEDIEIHTNRYKHEIVVGSGKRERFEKIDINHNQMFLEIPYENRTIDYEVHVNMDPTKLKIYFALNKTTNLYINSENPDNMYLDLEFLSQKN